MNERLMLIFTPHTTWTDGRFVIENLHASQPQVFLPEEPQRSYQELPKLRMRYENLAKGEKELNPKRRDYGFRKAWVDYLRGYGKIGFHFLEAHPLEVATMLREKHDEEVRLRKESWVSLEDDDLDGSCDKIYSSLKLKSEGGKVRAKSMNENARNLTRDVLDIYPELSDESELRMCGYLSGVYLPPVTQLRDVFPDVIEKPQGDPYTHLTHVEIVRGMILGEEEKTDGLHKYFIENTLEEKLREKIPDSIERFRVCREMAEGVSYQEMKSACNEILDSLIEKALLIQVDS